MIKAFLNGTREVPRKLSLFHFELYVHSYFFNYKFFTKLYLVFVTCALFNQMVISICSGTKYLVIVSYNFYSGGPFPNLVLMLSHYDTNPKIVSTISKKKTTRNRTVVFLRQ